MSDEMLRQKYRILRINLGKLVDKLIILNDVHDDVNLIIKELLLIDDKITMEDMFSSIKFVNNEVMNEISTIVIPIVDNKI